jgi:hypothetical protein
MESLRAGSPYGPAFAFQASLLPSLALLRNLSLGQKLPISRPICISGSPPRAAILEVLIITAGYSKIIAILLRSFWRGTLMMGRSDVYI